MAKHALKVSRAEDFSAWYQEVISAAELADNSSVRGCMVIRPYGFAIWERMQQILDTKFKELGHMNAYFPMFIPVDLFEREAAHVEGFAKEMAIVTHHRLETRDGKLVPSSPLETPLAVRPTSELIIGESISRWVKSYRDLPVMINQWCNVVRWEMRTRMFLRTTEFLWQEGHTAHESEAEAIAETVRMHDVYRWFIRDVLKMFGIPGQKPDYDKFAGAVNTYTVESMMQDGKALQAATSHYLGQNFSRAVDIQFQGRDGKRHHAHTSSWGISTRIVGGLIMSHSDDDGLNLPSEIAPYHVVIIPVIKNEDSGDVLRYCDSLKAAIPQGVRVFIDKTEITPQDKKWNYIRKGVPFIVELGTRERQDDTVYFTKRASSERTTLTSNEFVGSIEELIRGHDDTLEAKCRERSLQRLTRDLKTFGELEEFFLKDTGFVIAKWNGTAENIEKLDRLAVTVRCIPSDQSSSEGHCILSGGKTCQDALFARSY